MFHSPIIHVSPSNGLSLISRSSPPATGHQFKWATVLDDTIDECASAWVPVKHCTRLGMPVGELNVGAASQRTMQAHISPESLPTLSGGAWHESRVKYRSYWVQLTDQPDLCCYDYEPFLLLIVHWKGPTIQISCLTLLDFFFLKDSFYFCDNFFLSEVKISLFFNYTMICIF